MGFKCTESIQVAIHHLVKIADTTFSFHETYGGEKQCEFFLLFYVTLFFLISS